jgi:hypothetical protein
VGVWPATDDVIGEERKLSIVQIVQFVLPNGAGEAKVCCLSALRSCSVVVQCGALRLCDLLDDAVRLRRWRRTVGRLEKEEFKWLC